MCRGTCFVYTRVCHVLRCFPPRMHFGHGDCGGCCCHCHAYGDSKSSLGTCLLLRQQAWGEPPAPEGACEERVAVCGGTQGSQAGPLYLETVGEPLPGFLVDGGHGSRHIPVSPKSSSERFCLQSDTSSTEKQSNQHVRLL